jgi:hypothetical protein
MRALNDNTAAKGLRGWYLTPPRHGIRHLINPVVCIRIEALP